jgi:hypothetical protein
MSSKTTARPRIRRQARILNSSGTDNRFATSREAQGKSPHARCLLDKKYDHRHTRTQKIIHLRCDKMLEKNPGAAEASAKRFSIAVRRVRMRSTLAVGRPGAQPWIFPGTINTKEWK